MSSKHLRSPEKGYEHRKTGTTRIPRCVTNSKVSTPTRNGHIAEVVSLAKSRMCLITSKVEPNIIKKLHKSDKRSRSIDEKAPMMSRRGTRHDSPATSVRSSMNTKDMGLNTVIQRPKTLKKAFRENAPIVMRATLSGKTKKKSGHKSQVEKPVIMPSQNAIQRYEYLEMNSSTSSSQRSAKNQPIIHRQLTESEATLSGLSHKSGQLKNLLTKKMKLFECLQHELDTKNKEMLDTYNSMKVLHKKVMDTGDVIGDLPSLELVRKRLESKLRGFNDSMSEPSKDKADKKVQYPDAEARAKTVGIEVALIMAQKELNLLQESSKKTEDTLTKKNHELEEEVKTLTEGLKQKSSLADSKARDLEIVLLEKEQLKLKLMEFQEQIDKIESEMSKNLETETLIRERMFRETQRREKAEKDMEEEREKRKKAENHIENVAIELSQMYQCKKDLEKKLENASKLNEELYHVKELLGEKQSELDVMKQNLDKLQEELRKEQVEKEKIHLSESNLRLELEATQKTVRALNEELEHLRSNCEKLEVRSQEYKKYLNALRIHINASRQNSPESGGVKDLAEALKDKLSLLSENNASLVDELQMKDKIIEEYQEKLRKNDDLIRFLSSKEKEQKDTLNLLQSSLELRHMAEGDINQQLNEKNEEVQTLATSLEMRKRQVRQMKKIILRLEDNLIQFTNQKRKDKEQINQLKQTLASLQQPKSPDYALEHLIREIESEIYGDELSDETDRINDSDGAESNTNNVVSNASPTRFMLENIVQKSTLITTNERGNKNVRRRMDRVLSSKTSILNRNSSVKIYPYKKYRHCPKVGDASVRDSFSPEN